MKYSIDMSEKRFYDTVTVEADSENAAVQMVQDKICNGDVDQVDCEWDWEVSDIE